MATRISDSRFWMMRVEWLLEFEPQRIADLFKTNRKKLYRSIKEMVQMAMKSSERMRLEGVDWDQREEILADMIAPTKEYHDLPERLPENLEAEIMEWAENPVV